MQSEEQGAKSKEPGKRCRSIGATIGRPGKLEGDGSCTTEAPFDVAQDRQRTRSKKFLIKTFSALCELGASAVNTSS